MPKSKKPPVRLLCSRLERPRGGKTLLPFTVHERDILLLKEMESLMFLNMDAATNVREGWNVGAIIYALLEGRDVTIIHED